MFVPILAMILLAQTPWDETKVWKDYVERVGKAYALEVKWTKLEKPASTIFHGQPDPKLRTFRLLTRKPGYILLEEPNTSLTVWNGTKGIQLDLKAKSYRELSKKPLFEEASFLGLFVQALNPAKLEGKVTADNKGGTWLYLQMSHVDAHSSWEYYFSNQTSLPQYVREEHKGLIDWKGIIEYRIQGFDTQTMVLSTAFPVEPPKGFTPYKM